MMRRLGSLLLAALALGCVAAHADDGLGLKRGGNGADVTMSGLSSGAAMAVQYAVAHSAYIAGVGAVAGPLWGCADGRLSRALNDCMCARQALEPTIDAAREMAAGGKVDGLVSEKPRALKRSFVFHSPADATVAKQSGQANIDFLAAFIGAAPTVDRGNAADGSDHAGHGIIAPEDGNDPCRADGRERTFVRRCGAEDTAGKMLLALFAPGSAFDATKRVNHIPDTEVWRFDQTPLIDGVKALKAPVAPDALWLWWWPYASRQRQNFDMADEGYIYVPPSCRRSGSACRVHVALHGCRQTARDFATRAGYNNWAEHYRAIIVYPAIAPSAPVSADTCRGSPVAGAVDAWPVEPNRNGCWDWWGYLDPTAQTERYLTKAAPQVLVIERIIAEVTARR